jgi:peptide chain release factor 2
LRTVFDLEEKKAKIASILKESEKPEFWQDIETSGKLSKELSDLQEEVGEFEQLTKDFTDVTELAKLSENDEDAAAELPALLESVQARIKKQEVHIFLSGKYDRANAIVTITSGAGGQDAQDWATILQRMYERYCEKKGWGVQIVHQTFGEPGPDGRIGTKSVVLEITGSFAYGLLRRETGIHRLVRISPFSAKQLRHTSFAAVDVVPEIDTKQEKHIDINPDDIEFDYFRSSGPGGQNVNKRETAVRVTHLPTGIAVVSQAERSQQRNKEKALQILASRLYQKAQQERATEVARLKGLQAAIEWGSQIRSYVLHPYKMVKDTRTNIEVSNAEEVLEGELDEFIEAALRLPSIVEEVAQAVRGSEEPSGSRRGKKNV